MYRMTHLRFLQLATGLAIFTACHGMARAETWAVKLGYPADARVVIFAGP